MSQSSLPVARFAWAIGVLSTRLPVAMTPLALVFLGSEVYGSYTYGLALVGLYAAAEACFAPLLGMRLSGAYFRREITWGLLVSTAAYGVIAGMGAAGAQLASGLAILAGAGAAAVPGALRVAVTNIIAEKRVRQAFSIETVITMSCWAAAPALVAFVAFQVTPLLIFTGCSVLMLLGSVAVRVLPEAVPSQHNNSAGSMQLRARLRDLAQAWPIFLSAAIAMSIVSFLELLLPALLEERGGDPARSGVLLSALAVASIVGAVLYSVLKTPGSLAVQSLSAIAVMIVAAVAVALIEDSRYVVLFLCVLGVGQAVCLIARNLSLRENLPPELHVTGFAVLYSLSGIGYGLSAGVSAVTLSVVSAQATLLLGLVAALILAVVIGVKRVKHG